MANRSNDQTKQNGEASASDGNAHRIQPDDTSSDVQGKIGAGDGDENAQPCEKPPRGNKLSFFTTGRIIRRFSREGQSQETEAAGDQQASRAGMLFLCSEARILSIFPKTWLAEL